MASPEKAYLQPEKGERIPCLFNPTEFSLAMSNRWESSTAANRKQGPARFGGNEPATMALNLIFDTTGTGTAVTTYTDRLVGLMQISSKAPGYKAKDPSGRPLWVRFGWGHFTSFKMVITSLNLSFTYFGSDGTALRARADLQLRQFEDEARQPAQNPTSGTPMPHRVHQVQVGETLDRIASGAYGDASKWRDIAVANGILNPLAIEPGTLLALPDVEGSRYAR